MSKKTLISSRSFVVTVANDNAATLQSPILTPFQQGLLKRGGTIRKAIPVDAPLVVFIVRPTSEEITFQTYSLLTITRYSAQGGWESDFETDFAEPAEDVSGTLMLNKGVLEYDGSYDGVFKAELLVTNRTGSTQDIACQVHVYGNNKAGV